MTTETKVIKDISNLLGAITNPIIVFPGGWGDTLPDWLKQAVIKERLIENVGALKEGNMTGTDAEACAYLYTAGLIQPLDTDWTEIHLYVATQVYNRHRTEQSGVQVPEDIRVEELNDYQLSELRRLKNCIYERRVRERQERDRAERRERKEEETLKKKAERPTLFEL